MTYSLLVHVSTDGVQIKYLSKQWKICLRMRDARINIANYVDKIFYFKS